MKQKLTTVDQHLQEELKDSRFRKLYELEKEKTKIGALLIRYRINHKLTQTQLAKKVGVSQQHISKIENGIFNNFSTVVNVLDAIGYNLDIEATPKRILKTSSWFDKVEETIVPRKVIPVPERITYHTVIVSESRLKKSVVKFITFDQEETKEDNYSNVLQSEKYFSSKARILRIV